MTSLSIYNVPKELDFLKPQNVAVMGDPEHVCPSPMSILQARNLQTREISVTCLRSWTKESSWLGRKLTCHTAGTLFTSQSLHLVGERGCQWSENYNQKKTPTHVVLQHWYHLSSRSYKFKTRQVPSCENHHGLQPQCSKWEDRAAGCTEQSLDHGAFYFQGKFWPSVPPELPI